MMEVLAWFILIFLVIRTMISLVNFLSNLHLTNLNPETYPKVSLLIPARNEGKRIGTLLNDLKNLEYPDFEVIVCNDHSSDNTKEILNQFSFEDGRIRWFLSDELPTGWLGKNYACFQLAQRAQGEYFIFLDADVELTPNAINKAVSFFQNRKLALLSVCPQQKMETLAEKITVPMMNWILQSLLPIFLVSETKIPAFSAAIGQFMMFDAAYYQHFQWHSQVRNENVEDLHIARMIKASGLKTAVLFGNDDIFCRMYSDLKEAVLGFSRNIHEYFGGFRTIMIVFWMVVCFGPAIVWIALGLKYFIYFMILVIANRLFVAWTNHQSNFQSVLLHPLLMISFSSIVFYNIYRRMKKDTVWKGRRIKF